MPGRLLEIVRHRLRSLFWRSAVERDLDGELRFHLNQDVAERIGAGMTPGAARRGADSSVGGRSQVQEEVGDTWGSSTLDNLVRDIRYAWRGLRRQPVLVAGSAASIGLGVCVNVTIFSLANEFLLTSPTASHPEQLVRIQTRRGSHVPFQEWRELDQAKALAGVAGYQIERQVNWRGTDESVVLTPLLVTSNYFDVLGVPVARGRTFTAPEADARDDPRVVVISHGFWQQRLGGDSSTIGRTIDLNGRPYTVIGVLRVAIRAMPGFGLTPDVYLPLSRTLMPDLDDPQAAIVQLVGRLRDGQTLPAGRAALAAAADRLGRLAGDTLYRRVAAVSPAGGLAELGQLAPVGAFFGVLGVVVSLVLLIACANVAGLLLARNNARRREFAIRLSLGASRIRVVQQLATEGLWLALIGTAVGVALSLPILGLVNRLQLPISIPIELHLALNRRLLGLALGLVAGATLFSSLAPAVDAARATAGPLLPREAAPVSSRRLAGRGGLVTAQVAVSLVLLVTAALFLHNLARTQVIDPGFDVRHTLVARVSFPPSSNAFERHADFVDQGLERLLVTRGVRGAAPADGVPLTIQGGSTNGSEIQIEGQSDRRFAVWENLDVGPGYFSVMGIPVRRGRDFLSTDRSGAPRVAVVNEEFAARYFPGGAALGRHITLAVPGAEPMEIVGIVGNSKHRTLGETQRAAMYHPFSQRATDRLGIVLMIRTDGDPGSHIATVRGLLTALDRSTAVEAETTRSALSFALLPSRIGATLLGSLGVVGLVLAMVGLYAVISYSVSRRTAEIGIRLALGATRAGVVRLVLRDGVILVGIGVMIGLSVAAFLTRPLAMFLVAGLRASDPISYGVAAALLLLAGVLASWLPARRAAATDAMVALRQE